MPDLKGLEIKVLSAITRRKGKETLMRVPNSIHAAIVIAAIIDKLSIKAETVRLIEDGFIVRARRMAKEVPQLPPSPLPDKKIFRARHR